MLQFTSVTLSPLYFFPALNYVLAVKYDPSQKNFFTDLYWTEQFQSPQFVQADRTGSIGSHLQPQPLTLLVPVSIHTQPLLWYKHLI